MNLVDSCGWLECFADGPNADFFAPAIENPAELVVPSLCLFEVFKRVLSQRGEGDAFQSVAVMKQARVIDLDTPLALSAASLSARLSLAMADSVVLATARARDALVWTQDSDFKGLDGVKYIESH